MYDDIRDIVDRVASLPIEQIIGGEIKLYGSGTERDALCPFHNDHKLGSFKVNVEKNIWKCFGCGEGGKGGIGFYRKFHNLSYRDAVLQVGIKHRAVSENEAMRFMKAEASTQEIRQMVEQKVVQHAQPRNPKLDPEKLDKMYRTFISCCPPMSESFKANLMESRYLEPDDLKFFFAMPRYSVNMMANFTVALRANGLKMEDLDHTPGFFFDTVKGVHMFGDSGPNALGIIAHDAKGRVNGIQIRRDTDDKKKRYIWFSSGYADGRRPTCVNGTVNSGILDVLPVDTGNGRIVCTEGKFKALKLNKIGYSALNMHGVTSWPAEKVMNYARANGYREITLCYDADIEENDAVAKSAIKFSEILLNQGFTVSYMTWQKRYGKGIDDMINNNFAKKINIREGKWYNRNVLLPLTLTSRTA